MAQLENKTKEEPTKKKNPLMPVTILKYATKSFRNGHEYSLLTWLLVKDTVAGNGAV